MSTEGPVRAAMQKAVDAGCPKQVLLDLPAPRYLHHRLVRDAEGRKLSKSTHATALRALRRNGATPADLRRLIGLEPAPPL